MRALRTRRPLRRSIAVVAVMATAGLVACQDDDDQGGAGRGSAPVEASSSAPPAGAEDTGPAMSGPATSLPATTAPGSPAAPTSGAPVTPPSSASAAAPSGPGCGALPSGATAPTSLGALVRATPELSTLAGALADADLQARLEGPGPITLVAPTNAAFDGLDDATLEALLADPSGALARVLELHLVIGDHPLDQLLAAGVVGGSAGRLAANDLGSAVVVDAGGGPATVTCADVVTPNGRLHLVDAVLLPPPTDTEAIGGSRLYQVDPATGAASALGRFGDETGVLDVVAIDDATLIGLTDSAELLTFRPDGPDQPAARVPVTGIEGATLLALDRTADGALVGITDLSGLYRIDVASGAATPIGPGLDPGVDDLGVGLDVGPDGAVRIIVATGTNVTVDPGAGRVLAAAGPPAFAPGDPNAGRPPRVLAVASAADALLAVDGTTASLARLGPGGELTTIGPLGVTLTDGTGLDVAPGGAVYLTVPG